MSFILDALKKSESDRQRQSGPSLFEVKVAPPRRALPVWAVAIAVLLGINVIVISWMLLRHPAAQQHPAALAPPAASPDAAAAHEGGRDSASAPASSAAGTPLAQGGGSASAQTSDTSRPAAAAPATSMPPSAGAQGAAPAPASSGTAESAGQAATGGAASDYTPAVDPATGAGSAAAGGDLPLYQQIVTTDGLPALHLDLHVFANRPQDRFAMINMHRVGEGDDLPSGAHVDAIRPDGVVLTYHGTRFLLPRN